MTTDQHTSPAMARALAATDAYEQGVIDRRAESMAHMTDANIQEWINRIKAARSVPNYAIKVSSYEYDESFDRLWNYELELKRRQALQQVAA